MNMKSTPSSSPTGTTAAPRGRRWLTLAVGVAACLLIGFQFIPLPDAAGRIDAFPVRGANYASRDLPLEPAEQDIMGEARLVKRLCQTPSQRVVVSIIDGTRNRHAVHDPAYCLRGGGWKITGQEQLAVPGGHAAKLTLTKAGQSAEALFWFTDGRNRHVSPTSLWLASAARRLTFGQSGPAPLLVLIFPVEGVTPDWSRLWTEMPELGEL